MRVFLYCVLSQGDVLSIGDQSITINPAKHKELVPRLYGIMYHVHIVFIMFMAMHNVCEHACVLY